MAISDLGRDERKQRAGANLGSAWDTRAHVLAVEGSSRAVTCPTPSGHSEGRDSDARFEHGKLASRTANLAAPCSMEVQERAMIVVAEIGGVCD
jgi:hypothetical protein